MDTPILTTLTNLETALTTLTDSITSYAPNLNAASTLLSADTALTESLAQLATHSSNTLLLAHLHSLAENLAATYKQQIAGLADVRREILGASVKGPGALRGQQQGQQQGRQQEEEGDSGGGSGGEKEKVSGNPVDYKAVLAFARNLSQYSAPRGFKPPSVLRAEAEAEAEAQAQRQGFGQGQVEQQQMQNGNASTEVVSATEAQGQGSGDVVMGEAEDKNPGLESLDQGIKAWLDPQLQVPFLPWPSEEMIARSGLARVAGWAGAVDVPDEHDAKPEAEEERQKREEDERMETQRAEHEQRPREAQKPKVFMGLDDLYDPDEE